MEKENKQRAGKVVWKKTRFVRRQRIDGWGHAERLNSDKLLKMVICRNSVAKKRTGR